MNNLEEKFKYENLDERTKEYVNKAIDIFKIIEEKTLSIREEDEYVKFSYELDLHDKVILSLFTAGFLLDGDIKDILSKYNDLKLEDLLLFMEIKLDDIIKQNDNEYKRIYSNIFYNSLKGLLWGYWEYKNSGEFDFDKVSSELVFLNLKYSYAILKFFNLNDINRDENGIHPCFKEVEQLALDKGYIKKIDKQTKIPFIRKMPSNTLLDQISKKIISGNTKIRPTDFALLNGLIDPKELFEIDEDKINTTSSSIDHNDENIWNILDDIQKKFIGQETLVENLFYNIINNQNLAKRDDVSDGERSIIFIDGPTGTGKTAITREITEKLNIPFTSTSITNYSSTGYVGGNITDTLNDLLKKSNGDLEKAQRGIIVFDEFDKISFGQYGGLEMKRAVQQQLLDFMGGGKYKIATDNNPFFRQEINFDTSKLTFVCLGALTNLRTKKTEVKKSIGFGESNNEQINSEYSISPQDLIDLGLERELVGRFNTYLHSEEYSKETLLRILRESTISPMLGFKKWISSAGKTLEIEDGVEEIIAEEAYKLNTGARSLQTIMNNIRTPFIKEVLRGRENTIYLDLDTVKKIEEDTLNRRARM